MNLTILIPTRAEESRRIALIKAISSALIIKEIDIEVIVIVDGFDFQEVECLLSAYFCDSRLHVLGYKTQRGKGFACELGFKHSSYEYIVVLDDDDELSDECGQIIAPIIHNGCISVFYTDFIEKEEIEAIGKVFEKKRYSCDFDPILLMFENYIPQPSLICTRDAWIKAGGYDASLPILEDWDFFRRLAFYFDFKHVQKITGKYNRKIGNISRSTTLDDNPEMYAHFLTSIIKKVPINNANIPITYFKVYNGPFATENLTHISKLRIPHFTVIPHNLVEIGDHYAYQCMTWDDYEVLCGTENDKLGFQIECPGDSLLTIDFQIALLSDLRKKMDEKR